ncbi:hypothetical protein AAHA92_00893 [Salvia divinorum]|uniref:Uncharacterized protein n=1 Tax=Salvia divinorum TaxID=28513 RepID=A0ABD1IL36_SALDI
MSFCQKSISAGSSGSLQLASVEKVLEIEEPNMEKNPLPLEANQAKMELKTLPLGLKYSYLGENETLPVIVSSKLTQG